jgi:hypothetical protein
MFGRVQWPEEFSDRIFHSAKKAGVNLTELFEKAKEEYKNF